MPELRASVQKKNPVKSKKLRDSARGQNCTLNIAGVCNYNPETVVLCHFPSDVAGSKATDISSGFGCSACHDAVDGRVSSPEFQLCKDFYMRRSQIRTWHAWLSMGLIKVA